MTMALAAVQDVLPPLPDVALLTGQLAPASIAGYRRDVAGYLCFRGAAAMALAPAWQLHSFPVWPGWGSLPLGRPLGGRRECWHRPQRTQAARGLRLECEDGDGAGAGGGQPSGIGAPRCPAGKTRRRGDMKQ